MKQQYSPLRLLLLLGVILSFVSLVKAQTSDPVRYEFQVDEPATLEAQLTDEILEQADEVVIRGNICQLDIRQIKLFASLDLLDMSEANIVEYYQESTGATFPANTLGASSFEDRKQIKKLILPRTLKEIGDRCFYANALEEVVFPEGLEKIGSAAFQFNSGLTKVQLPKSLKEIGTFCFSMCEGIQEITLGGELKVISAYCFSGCAPLTSIVVPDGIEEIHDAAFKGCASVTEITIPASVKKIGVVTFAQLPALERVTCLGMTAPNIEAETFDETAQEILTIRINKDAYDSFLDHFVWQLFIHYEDLEGMPLGSQLIPTVGLEQLYGVSGGIQICNAQGASISVYDLSGLCVTQLEARASDFVLPLAVGQYVISIDGRTYKWLVS